MTADVVIISVSYIVSLAIRFQLLNGNISINLYDASYILMSAIYGVTAVFIFYLLKMYGTYRFTSYVMKIFFNNQNHALNAWFAQALEGTNTGGTSQEVLNSPPTAYHLQAAAKAACFFCPLILATCKRVNIFFERYLVCSNIFL